MRLPYYWVTATRETSGAHSGAGSTWHGVNIGGSDIPVDVTAIRAGGDLEPAPQRPMKIDRVMLAQPQQRPAGRTRANARATTGDKHSVQYIEQGRV